MKIKTIKIRLDMRETKSIKCYLGKHEPEHRPKIESINLIQSFQSFDVHIRNNPIFNRTKCVRCGKTLGYIEEIIQTQRL
jgi:hypothetical protein